jgi:hypothetical protein
MGDLAAGSTTSADPSETIRQGPSFIVETGDTRASQLATERVVGLDQTTGTRLTSVDENFINQRRLEFLRARFTEELLCLLRDQDFEYGVDTKADAMVRQQMSLNKLATKSWLNTLFVENFANSSVLIGLLRIIARLDYVDVFPEGQTMAVAALSNSNIGVKECGVRAFESWGTIQSLEILENLTVSAKWLQEYIDHAVADLRKEYNVAVG